MRPLNGMTLKEAESLFLLAGFGVSRTKPLIDGYFYGADDPRFFENPPRQTWWFVKTEIGWVEIGWRKKVISIDWSDTDIRAVITNDDVTKEAHFVHAWSIEKALEYLKALKEVSQTAARK